MRANAECRLSVSSESFRSNIGLTDHEGYVDRVFDPRKSYQRPLGSFKVVLRTDDKECYQQCGKHNESHDSYSPSKSYLHKQTSHHGGKDDTS